MTTNKLFNDDPKWIEYALSFDKDIYQIVRRMTQEPG